MLRLHSNRRNGFSMIELVLVIAIMLAIAAMALPKFLNFTATYQLRNGLTSISGVLQQAREYAVRTNTAVPVNFAGNNTVIYVDTPNPTFNSTWDATEPGAQLPKQIQIKTSGYPGDAYANLWTGITTAYSAESQSTTIRFNARGLPCVVISGICQNLDTTGGGGGGVPAGFVIYVQNTGKYGLTGWGAVTVSPSGRVQTWIWNGNAYSKQ